MSRPPVTSRTGHRGGKDDCKAPGGVFKSGKKAARDELAERAQQRTGLSELIEASRREISFAMRFGQRDDGNDKGIG